MQDPHDPEPSGAEDDDGLIMHWTKERAAKELVKSIQRRVVRSDHEEIKVTRAKNKAIRKSRSFDERLAKLVPEVERFPVEDLKAWSLDRHRMKQSLPFELLATTMCPPMGSVGDAFPAALSAAIFQSRDGPKAASLGKAAADGMEVFEDDHKAAQSQFRARTRAFRLRDGERRNRRLTEPLLYKQDYSRSDHM